MSSARKQRTVITTETLRRTVVRSSRNANRIWCEQCGQEVLMLAPDEAAALAFTTTRLIFRRLEAGRLHFQETPDGRLLVCGRSTQPEYQNPER